jgi:hypothetical protein
MLSKNYSKYLMLTELAKEEWKKSWAVRNLRITLRDSPSTESNSNERVISPS